MHILLSGWLVCLKPLFCKGHNHPHHCHPQGGNSSQHLGLTGSVDALVTFATSQHQSNDPAFNPLAHLASWQQQHAHAHAGASAAQQRRDSATGRSLKGRVGSVTSISEEDVFSTTGGMDLGGLEYSSRGIDDRTPNAAAAAAAAAPSDAPTRTLLVQNVSPSISDNELRQHFADFGDLQAFDSGAKARGAVLVSYYDIRAAVRARRLMHGMTLGDRPIGISFAAAPRQPAAGSSVGSSSAGSGGALRMQGGFGAPGTPDSATALAAAASALAPSTPLSQAAAAAGAQVDQGRIYVYNLDPNTTTEHLAWIMGKFGEVKDVRESATRANLKVVEFFDTRHAAAALTAMNRAELAGAWDVLGAAGFSNGSGSGSGERGPAGAPLAAQVAQQQDVGSQAAFLMQYAAQLAANRGMSRPGSHELLAQDQPALAATSAPLAQGWDSSMNDSMLRLLGGQQQRQHVVGSGGFGAVLPGPGQLPLHAQQPLFGDGSGLQQAFQPGGHFGGMVSCWRFCERWGHFQRAKLAWMQMKSKQECASVTRERIARMGSRRRQWLPGSTELELLCKQSLQPHKHAYSTQADAFHHHFF